MLEHARFANDFDDVYDGFPIPLHSSNICCITWDDALGELQVHFVGSGRDHVHSRGEDIYISHPIVHYTYLDVPRWKVRRLLLASSAGRYFSKNIKDRYVFVKEE
jgi:hypothetical protein